MLLPEGMQKTFKFGDMTKLIGDKVGESLLNTRRAMEGNGLIIFDEAQVLFDRHTKKPISDFAHEVLAACLAGINDGRIIILCGQPWAFEMFEGFDEGFGRRLTKVHLPDVPRPRFASIVWEQLKVNEMIFLYGEPGDGCDVPIESALLQSFVDMLFTSTVFFPTEAYHKHHLSVVKTVILGTRGQRNADFKSRIKQGGLRSIENHALTTYKIIHLCKALQACTGTNANENMFMTALQEEPLYRQCITTPPCPYRHGRRSQQQRCCSP